MLGEQGGIVSEVSKVEMKRRVRIKIEGAKTIFFVWRKKQEQKELNQFKMFCTGSKNFVLVQNTKGKNWTTTYTACNMYVSMYVW